MRIWTPKTWCGSPPFPVSPFPLAWPTNQSIPYLRAAYPGPGWRLPRVSNLSSDGTSPAVLREAVSSATAKRGDPAFSGHVLGKMAVVADLLYLTLKRPLPPLASPLW